MAKIAQDRQELPDFPYTSEELHRIAQAVVQEAYPPAQRTGWGAAVRQDEPLWTAGSNA